MEKRKISDYVDKIILVMMKIAIGISTVYAIKDKNIEMAICIIWQISVLILMKLAIEQEKFIKKLLKIIKIEEMNNKCK